MRTSYNIKLYEIDEVNFNNSTKVLAKNEAIRFNNTYKLGNGTTKIKDLPIWDRSSGGGSGGVESVTGDLVSGTATNPIINLPDDVIREDNVSIVADDGKLAKYDVDGTLNIEPAVYDSQAVQLGQVKEMLNLPEVSGRISQHIVHVDGDFNVAKQPNDYPFGVTFSNCATYNLNPNNVALLNIITPVMGLINQSGGQPYVFEITTTRTTAKDATLYQPYQYAVQTIKCYTSVEPKQLIAEVSRIGHSYTDEATWSNFTATRSAILGSGLPEGVVNGARGSVYINGLTGIPYIKLSGQVYSADRANWKGFGTTFVYTEISESKVLETTDFDNSKMICITGTDVTLSIPVSMSALPIGTMMTFFNKGDTNVTIAPNSGSLILTGTDGMFKCKPKGEFKLRKTGTNEWFLTGDLTTT